MPALPTAGFRILLIDDNADANESMAALLEIIGYTVSTAPNGQEALECVVKFAPHLILCDIGLPGMTGYDLVPALRAQMGPRQVIIAAVTGYGQESDVARSKAAGFDHHLVKPLDADVLLTFVSEQARLLP